MSESIDVVINKLRNYPSIAESIEQLLDIIINKDGKVRRADDAEALVIAGIRGLGKKTLEEWGKEEAEKQSMVMTKGNVEVRKKSKKNSAGGQHLAPSQ